MAFRFLRQMLVVLTVSGLGHWVLGRWALRVFPRLRAHPRRLQWLLVVLTASPYLLRGVSLVVKSSFIEQLGGIAMLEFMLAALCAVPVGLLQAAAHVASRRNAARARTAATANAGLTSDAGTTANAGATSDAGATPGSASEANAPAPAALSLTRREALERAGGLAVLGTTSAILGWGMARGRHAFVIEEVPVRIPGLPRALDGYTIVQVSDIHVGLFVGERELREGFDRVREARPDLIVATGDLIDYDPRFAPIMARALGDLQARDGVFAILGNHDYYTGHEEVRRALAATRVDLLVNAGRRIRPADGGGFALLGMDDRFGRSYGGQGPDFERTIAMVPDVPRILLAHQPPCFDWTAKRVALQLSGHTHGGQINPGFRPASLLMEYIEGRYERDGSTLWVNRGFGVAGPPSRIGAPPEVTKIILVAA